MLLYACQGESLSHAAINIFNIIIRIILNSKPNLSKLVSHSIRCASTHTLDYKFRVYAGEQVSLLVTKCGLVMRSKFA